MKTFITSQNKMKKKKNQNINIRIMNNNQNLDLNSDQNSLIFRKNDIGHILSENDQKDVIKLNNLKNIKQNFNIDQSNLNISSKNFQILNDINYD